MTPYFSVIIPTYNRAHVITRSIESLIAQTESDFELIVVDDGSVDNTATVLNAFSDSRIHYHRIENSGVCAARNYGAKLAKGNYLAFLDSDDWVTTAWLNNFKQSILESNFDVVVCKRTLVADPSNLSTSFLAGAFAVKRNLFIEIGGYEEQIRFGENTELRWRLEDAGSTFGVVHAANLVYDNTSEGGSVNRANKLKSFYLLQQKHQRRFDRDSQLAQTYYQVAAVDAFHLGKRPEARKLIWQGYAKNPLNPKAFARAVYYELKSRLG